MSSANLKNRYLYTGTTYKSKDGYEIVILSANKNEQGEVVSYNIFDPNGISSKNIVSVN